jgi:hypothetical protein
MTQEPAARSASSFLAAAASRRVAGGSDVARSAAGFKSWTVGLYGPSSSQIGIRSAASSAVNLHRTDAFARKLGRDQDDDTRSPTCLAIAVQSGWTGRVPVDADELESEVAEDMALEAARHPGSARETSSLAIGCHLVARCPDAIGQTTGPRIWRSTVFLQRCQRSGRGRRAACGLRLR